MTRLQDLSPLDIARARIAEEAERRTGSLDLSNLGLERLPDELFALTHLRELDLGALPSWDNGARPSKIDRDRWRLSSLGSLEKLSVAWSDLASVDFVESLTSLASLDCRGTQVGDLAPLARLTALTSLDCSSTQVGDLAPLVRLTALTSLDCSSTQVGDLAPLVRLTALTSLDCRHTQVGELAPLAGLTALTSLDCSSTQVGDLAPLAGLTALTSLDCSHTQVVGLAPLAGLTALTSLVCSGTQVGDLAPLARLTALTSLVCSGTQVGDLAPLARLTALTSLVCSGTQVGDLAPLAHLTALTSLVCSRTQVVDLAPLARLTALTSLDCWGTQVVDLSPLAGLTALTSLDCSRTQVVDLSPLADLTALTLLDCSRTQVVDLSPLAGLTALTSLDCSGCKLHTILHAINLPRLTELVAFETFVPGIPHGVLSTSYSENCLEAVRAHFADQAAEPVDLPHTKLLLLGNGCAGKTQIARWLAGQPFEEPWDSTHGIRVAAAPQPESIAARLHLRMWDFGGQDIYHGTHALFLRGPAILMPVWARDRENSDTYEHEGLTFRNHPLAYWLEVARHQTNPDNPVLVVQNKCDTKGDEARPFPIAAEALTAFQYPAELRVSPKVGRGRGNLEETLEDAIAWMRERHGTPRIGAGRLRVQRRLEALREADMELPRDERRHRLMERADFDAICDAAGGVSSTDHLLAYLDANGTLIHRPGLFGGRIILDQGWALDAIYAVFDRKRVYKVLRGDEGRFTRAKLGLLVWQEHSDEEQELLLGMMRSCGMCFTHQRYRRDEDTEYIAPDLLPDRAAVADRLAGRWDEDHACETATFSYPLLHDGVIRAIMAEIGELAGADALYWRGGLCAFETRTRSRLLIDSRPDAEGWANTIRVRTQDGRSEVLFAQAIEVIKRVQTQLGMTPTTVDTMTRPLCRIERPAGPEDAELASAPALVFSQEKPAMPEWYVSYAWGDDKSPDGRQREAVVDKLCTDAAAKGLVINRDKNVLRLGDSISGFMRRIGAGDRVFVILSEKYLRSPFCMFELTEVWRTSQQESADFLDRVRVYALPDAKVWTPNDWADWAIHWKQEYEALEGRARQHGYGVLGDAGSKRLGQMQRFHTQVADILGTLADIVQPRTLEQLEQWGFEDPPPEPAAP